MGAQSPRLEHPTAVAEGEPDRGQARPVERSRSTMNRDHLMRVMQAAREHGIEPPGGVEAPDPVVDVELADDFGTPEALITTFVDVSTFLDQKRAAMAAHASQIDESSFFLAMPKELFAAGFGTEWFIRRDASLGARETWLFGDS